MRGINDGELPAIADLARTMPVDVRFIELMPLSQTAKSGAPRRHAELGSASRDSWMLNQVQHVGGVLRTWWEMYVGADEIREILGDLTPMANESSSSARLYSIPGGLGAIGIISPMSEPFCDMCNRVRVTSSGGLKPCLRLPIEADLGTILHEPDFSDRLGELLSRLGCHKLSEASSMISAIEAQAMCSIGG
jgi:cyclic pyranopterin phosphate synthase